MSLLKARRDGARPPAYLRELADAAPMAMAVTSGARHELSYANPAFNRLVGDRSIPTGAPLGTALSGSLQASVSALLDRVYVTRSAETLSHLEQQREDGKSAWWTWVVWPISGRDGATGLLVEILDVTEQVLRERSLERTAESIRELSERLVVNRIRADELSEELEHAERRFRAFVETAPDAEVIIDPAGRIALINACTEEMFGFDRAELLGRSYAMLVPTGLAEVLGAQASRSSDAGWTAMREALELQARHRRGHEFPVEVLVSSFVADEGRLFILSFRDITDRKRAEDERARLLAAEQRARAEAENARHKLAVLAQASTLLSESFDTSSTLSRVARLLVPELADWCAFDLVDERLGEELADERPARPVAAAAAEGFPLDKAERIRERLVPWVLKHDLPVIFPSENPLMELENIEFADVLCLPLLDHEQVVGVMTLLNLRPRNEPPDLTFARELSFRAGVSVEAARLFQKTVRAVNSRDNLLAVVSHDLRNLLSTLMLDAQSLLKSVNRQPEHPNSRIAQRIDRNVQQMNALIQDLVDSAGMTGRALQVVFQEQDILPLIHQVVEMMRPVAAARSILLEDVLPAGEGPLLAPLDRVRLTQVLTNLIGNALKFTPEKGFVTVALEPRPGELLISVKDTGPGIPEQDLPHIFDRFWKAPRENRTGVGLGLFIAKGIVEAHNGRIWVDTREGAGSTFYFTVPTGRSRGGSDPSRNSEIEV